jgi:hypothetical protein
MKYAIIVFLLLPLYAFACSCDPPPAALEFLKSKYVVWGSVIKKEYAADSLTYAVTLKIDKHFKTNKGKPQKLTFTQTAEGRYTGNYTSCDFSVNEGESWLVYAYENKGALTFGYFCSNSKPYSSYDNIRKEEMEILSLGNSIDLDKIIFERTSIRNLAYSEEYQKPEPKIPLDTLLAQVDRELYHDLEDSHFENFIINIDKKGMVNIVAVHRRQKNFEIKRVYDVMYPAYTSIDSLNTNLQNEIIKAIMKGKRWEPAEFMGKKVNSQVHLQVYFRKSNKPYYSIN